MDMHSPTTTSLNAPSKITDGGDGPFDPIRNLVGLAEAPDPGCWVVSPTFELLEPLGKDWTYGGDSLKHYGDEWTRSDGATLVVTVDGPWLMGLYPDICNDDEDISFQCAMWSFDSYDDLLIALGALGVTEAPVMADPARYGCHDCRSSITENVAAGREVTPDPRRYSPLLPARPLGEVNENGYSICADCTTQELTR